MEDVIVKFTQEQFLQTTEPYDYLVSISNPMERDREIAAYKKFALKNCDISAATFKLAMKKAYAEREARESENTPGDARVTSFRGQKLALRCPGYYCNDSGIWKDGAFGPTLILAHPIMPIRRIVNYDTGECKTMIAFRTGKDWREQIVSREALSSRVKIVQQLAASGAYVTSENCSGVISYLADVENANIDRLEVAHSASRMGWIDGMRFLPYEDDLVFDGDQRFGEMYRSITENGDRDTWFDLAGAVRSGPSVAARVMLATSFASVLVKPLSALPFIVHCWSDVSGTGKTVALMLAASVWADPSEGAFVRNMNTTNAAVEMVAGFLNSLPMCLDELCTRDKRDGAENLVYMICESSGRSRASRNGGIQQQQRWRNCAITTGETPILTENSRAGAENRVIDLEVDSALFDDPISTANTIRENYGFAGKQFIEALQQDGAIEEVKAYYDNYLPKLRNTGATAKQAIPMAVILAADHFATVHVFNDRRNLTVSEVFALLKSNEQVDTNRRAYDWLMGTIAENNMRFAPIDEHYTGPIWGKIDDQDPDNVTACIVKTRFSALMHDAGFNDKSFLKWAKRENVIQLDSAGKTTCPVRIKGLETVNTRCVCIRMNALKDNFAPDGFHHVELSEEEIPW